MTATPTDEPSSTPPSGTCGGTPVAPWPKLRRLDWIAPGLTVGLVAVLALPRLPPGICFGDAGDLQLASVTLGIMHPPGYAGYATLGWLVSHVPGVNPAYMVSLACLASGLAALWLCLLMQIRVGVPSWIAGALGLGLTAHPRVWSNLVAPEVYAPSLALLTGAAYLLVRFARKGARWDLSVAALLYGLAVANRPPLVFMLPFLAVAWWMARRRWDRSWRQSAVSLVLGTSCMLLPCCYSFGYLWLRDRPDSAYNYIEQHNAGARELPDSTAGWRAKLDRVVWEVSGRQFRTKMGTTELQARIKLLWLRHELLPPERQDALAVVVLIVFFGAVITCRRCLATFVVLLGLVVGTVAYVFLYRVYGQAADLLPLLFAAAVFVGVALSSIIPSQAGRRGTLAGIGLFALSVILNIGTVSYRPQTGVEADAIQFLEQLDLETMPHRAVLAASWSRSTPLWYAKHMLASRNDIDIINIHTGQWLHRLEVMGGRPLFATMPDVSVAGFRPVPFRNINRLVPTDRSDPP